MLSRAIGRKASAQMRVGLCTASEIVSLECHLIQHEDIGLFV
jgi:hypothetical protein